MFAIFISILFVDRMAKRFQLAVCIRETLSLGRRSLTFIFASICERKHGVAAAICCCCRHGDNSYERLAVRKSSSARLWRMCARILTQKRKTNFPLRSLLSHQKSNSKKASQKLCFMTCFIKAVDRSLLRLKRSLTYFGYLHILEQI